MSDTRRIYGLVGYPLGHSFSQNYFIKKFMEEGLTGFTYENFEMQDVSSIRKKVMDIPHLYGFNVTVPHKVSIMQYLDQISDEAREIGAVNTVTVLRNGNQVKLNGYNTDAHGFEKSIKPFLKFTHHRALVLGTGGASKAVVFVLKKLGVDVVLVSRNQSRPDICTYDLLNEHLIKSHLLIVNTTPLGMFPSVETFPDIPYQYLSEDHFLIDLVYNPEETVFLKKGKEKNALTLNGLSMLHLQAEKAFEIWSEREE
ncbi:MAG: shikimate dehydrogenase family protein [Flavobacteriales bacterium]